MSSHTTHPEFNAHTEAKEVAEAFADGIRGKTILVTGVNKGGLGYATCEAFASQSPAHIILASRTPSKLQDCISSLQSLYPSVTYRALPLDLSSQASVRAAASTFLSWTDIPKLDILINNAAVMGFVERQLTPEGLEMHFGTNHIGHWLLTCLLMPKLLLASPSSSGPARIVNVSALSPTWSSMRWSDLLHEKRNDTLPPSEQPNYDVLRAWGYLSPEEESYVPLEGYNVSKIANLLSAIGLTKRLLLPETGKKGILAVAVHPGVIVTELGREIAPETMRAAGEQMEKGLYEGKTLGAGAATTLVGALDPGLVDLAVMAEGKGGKNKNRRNLGSYLMDCQVSDEATELACSSEEADRLWEVSEGIVGERFGW